MSNYIKIKKYIYEMTDYKHDLKGVNPNFGKKKQYRKS